MACGNGSDRTQHPVELFGEDWMAFGLDAEKGDGPAEPAEPASPSPQVISLHHP
jgi:hypothetical protein